MKMRNRALLALLLAPLVIGCGSSSETSATGPTGDDTTQATVNLNSSPSSNAIVATKPLQASTPKEAVETFLESVRVGDAVSAEMILTETARVAMKKEGLDVKPPQNPDAQYTLGKTEYEDDAKTGAYVASSWTAKDKDGVIQTDEIVWILRKEIAGWRLAGMAVKPDPLKPPRIFNFEDPLDMLSQIKEAEKEFTEESQPPATAGTIANPAIRQATVPPEPGAASTPLR
jgi:hypothetical protein